jgi:cell wall-associated NlpC family hydrolase
MEKQKLKPREVKRALIVTLSTVILGTVMLVQPLGLLTAWQDNPNQPDEKHERSEVTSTVPDSADFEYGAIEGDMLSRSLDQYPLDPAILYDPELEGSYDSDYDPNDTSEPAPDDYNPVDDPDEPDEPVVLEPIEKPQGLVYEDTEFVLYIKANELNLRAGPSTDTTIITTLEFGDKVVCEGENDEWMKVRYGDQLGFLKSEYTSQTMVFKSVSQTVYVKANTLNLRSGPSTDDEIITKLGHNDRLTRTGIGDEWSRVKTASGKEGYVASEYLTTTAPVTYYAPSSTTPSRSGTVVSGDAGRIVDLAYQMLGKPYVYGAHSPSVGFDCTGLTYWAYRQIGVSVPRSSGSYYSAGASVSYSNIKPGDVICWDVWSRGGVNHVGIYVGNDMMIHASTSKGKVVLQSVSQYRSWGVRLVTVRRFVSG